MQLHPGNFMTYEFRLLRGDVEVALLSADATGVRSVHGMVPFVLELPTDTGPFDRSLVDLPIHPSQMIAALRSVVLVP